MVYMVHTKPLLTLDDVNPLPADSRLDTVKERRRATNPDDPYDMDLLGACERSWISKDPCRQERAINLRYLFGNQWGDIVHVHGFGDVTEEEVIRAQGNVPLKNNILVSLWQSVYGIHAKQDMEPVCYARNEKSKEMSEMLSAALQANWQNTYMAEKLDTAYAEYLISGMAFLRESYEEREEIHDSYTDYINPYYMFWEGGSDPTHQDIHMIGCLHDITPEELFFRFARPEYNLTIEKLKRIYHLGKAGQAGYAEFNTRSYQPENEKHRYENISFRQPSEAGLCRVIEVWREEVKPRWQCCDLLSPEPADKFFRCEDDYLPVLRNINLQRKAMYDEQDTPEDKRLYITARAIVDKYWQYYFLAPDGRILCEGETPYDYKSHPFSVALFPFINGETHPFMSYFRDQQKYINRTIMMGDLALKNAAKGMTFLPLSMKPDDMTIEEYANQKTRYDSVFVYDDMKPEAMRSNRKPEFFTHSAFNIGTTEMLQMQMNMIHDVSGVSGSLQGKTPPSGTAASLYAMSADNATTTLYPLLKKFNGLEERCAKKKCITIQQYYEEGRDITPRKAETQIFYRANAARNVKVNISIKNSAASAAYVQLGNEMLDRLFELGAIDVRTYLKHYEAPGVEKILQDFDNYVGQVKNGQVPAAPVQVPGADQGQADMATQALRGGGQLFTRQAPGQRRTMNNVA